MGCPHEAEITDTEQSRGQCGANNQGLQHSALLQSEQDSVAVVVVQHHHWAAPGLTPGDGWIVSQFTGVDGWQSFKPQGGTGG